MRLPRLDSSRIHFVVATGLVSTALFAIAWDNGSYGTQGRNALGIAAWWAFIVVVVFGLLPKTGIPRAVLRLAALLAAFAVWTLASLLWAPGAEQAFDEFNRVALYLGVLVLVGTLASRRSLPGWVAGLAVALAVVSAVALTSRFFPSLLPDRDLDAFLPAAATRLSFPVGYWNGLAILVALAVPLLLGLAVVVGSTAGRGLALAPIPLIASVIYLASSRGGMACAGLGTVTFLILTERRWTAAAATMVAALGSAVAILVLLQRDELVDGPLGTELAERQGRSAALLIVLICVVVGAAYGAGSDRARRRDVEPPRALGWLLVVAAAVIGVVALRAADPLEQFRRFKAPPGELEAIEPGDFVTQHLLSSRGSGRWQFWDAAVAQWEASPLWGGGAGSYEAWWARNGSISHFVRDAHSLYLETLGELGIVGLALVLTFVVGGVVAAALRARRESGDDRVYIAALASVFTAFAAVAALDWVWELTAVSVVAMAALALATGTVPEVPERLAAVEIGVRPAIRPGFAGSLIAVLAVCLLLIAQAIPLLAQRQIDASQEAVARGDLQDALEAAESARDIQPWATSPYLQLALVGERMGALPVARTWIEDSIARDRDDWHLWLVKARLETKLGRVPDAKRSLRRAAELNPRSPLFKGLTD